MKIWLLNQYASLPRDGIGGRHRHIARELAALGHEVTVVAARWTHLTRDSNAAQAAPALELFEGFKFLRIDLPKYRHAHDPRRILNWALFALRLPGLPRLLGETPDVVLYSSPSLVGFLGAERLARKVKARLVFEVRDIWPMTLTEIGSHSTKHPFIRLLQWIEDRAYRVADRVVSNLPGAVDHMVRRGMDPRKFEWIPNGMSKAELDAPSMAGPTQPEQMARGRFVVGYAGTLALVASLETVLEAALLLNSDTGVVFVLVGSGAEGSRLQEAAARMNLLNIIFLPPVPKSQVQSVIETFDACLLCWRSSPLYEYGIAPNKLFDYFYAAKPVIHAYSGRHDPVSLYKAGVTVPAGDPEALAAAILQLRDAPESERAKMGRNGRRAALRHHEYSEIAKKLQRVLLP